jgi:tetratricopeptide (TPR) repeat protein
MFLRLIGSLTVCAGLLACGGRSGREAQPAPVNPNVEQDVPLAEDEGDERDGDEQEPLDITLAQKLVTEVEARWAAAADHPLRTPSTLQDVEQILKLDQVALFRQGVELARSLDGVEARALEAQIELAWGESYLALLQVMLRLNEQLEQELATLSQRADIDTGPRDELRRAVRRSERLAEAFELLSIEHSTLGAARANALITKYPSSYLGYRVAADFYRMVRDWRRFAQMVSKIEQLNPASNGLVFLRGTAASLQHGDSAAAATWFRRALDNDPQFVRAQVHLLLLQKDIESTYAEFQALKQLNPSHQIVHWAGESIELAFRLHRSIESASPPAPEP